MKYRGFDHIALIASEPVLAQNVNTYRSLGLIRVSNPNCDVTFTGESAELFGDVLDCLGREWSVSNIARQTGYSSASILEHLLELSDEAMLYWKGLPRNLTDPAIYKAALRSEAAFWNSQIFQEPMAQRLFRGGARTPQVIRWGVEFYHFIAAANTYMPRAIANLGYAGSEVDDIVKHYVEESDHDAIFRDGLLKCGVLSLELDRALPIAGTSALINFLWETAASSSLEYMALFAVMQPIVERPSELEIQSKYNALKMHYPYAETLFAAFERHDLLDAGYGHSEWALEKWIDRNGVPRVDQSDAISRTMRLSSECFSLFYRDIERSCATVNFHEPRIAPNAQVVLYQ